MVKENAKFCFNVCIKIMINSWYRLNYYDKFHNLDIVLFVQQQE